MPYFIKAKQDQGRFRAGRHHSAKGKPWPDSAFTPEQLAAIREDQELDIKELTPEEFEAYRKEDIAHFADTVATTGIELVNALSAVAKAEKKRKAAKAAASAKNTAQDAKA